MSIHESHHRHAEREICFLDFIPAEALRRAGVWRCQIERQSQSLRNCCSTSSPPGPALIDDRPPHQGRDQVRRKVCMRGKTVGTATESQEQRRVEAGYRGCGRHQQPQLRTDRPDLSDCADRGNRDDHSRPDGAREPPSHRAVPRWKAATYSTHLCGRPPQIVILAERWSVRLALAPISNTRAPNRRSTTRTEML
jgi:hypothetical protein